MASNAFVFAMAGILIYIGLRFRFSFAVGAIVAVAHDILVTVSLLMFFGYELSLNVVAAMLTITGYSVNDSIVVFDRVRENLRKMRRDKFDHLVNTSVNQTLARTIITSGTTGFRRACPVCLRRRSAPGVRLHDARRRDQRDLFDHFHRRRDRHPDHRGKGEQAGQASHGARKRAAAVPAVAALETAGPQGPRVLTR